MNAEPGRLKEIALVFLRLGCVGFGGPVAMMAMMEEEAVRQRKWLSPEAFNEVYAICKLLPGPVATQMAIYLGAMRAGRKLGGVVSGVVFILPAFLIVFGLSVFYSASPAVSRASTLFAGLQAGALAVVLLSTWSLAKGYRRNARAWVVIAISAAIVFLHPGWEPLVILGFGLMGVGMHWRRLRMLSVVFWPALTAGTSVVPSKLLSLFWVCFKAGAFVFGTGLAVVPMLEADVVGKHGWLTHSQFMDGLVMGQVTPGPMVITSTFIGYLTQGWLGACVATLGIFLPAFVNVLFLVPRIWGRFSGTAAAAGFSAWAIPAVVGGILGTVLLLALATFQSPLAVVIFAATVAVALWKNFPAWLLIPAAGLASVVLSALSSSLQLH